MSPSRETWCAALVALGVIACTPEYYAEPQLSSVEAYLRNTSDADITVTVFPLRNITLNCDEVAEDPGGYLTPEAFDAGGSVVVAAGTNAALPLANPQSSGNSNECTAALLDTAEGHRVVFWMRGELPQRSVPVDADALSNDTPGAIVLTPAEGGVQIHSTSDIIYTPAELIPTAGEIECTPVDDTTLVWDEPQPQGWWHLAELGQDERGCLRLHLSRGEVGTPDEERLDWNLCLDESEFPFETGGAIEFGGDAQNLLLTGFAPGAAPYEQPKAVFYSGNPKSPLWPEPRLRVLPVDRSCVPQHQAECYGVATPMGIEAVLDHTEALGVLTGEQRRLDHTDQGGSLWSVEVERAARYTANDDTCRDASTTAPDVRVRLTRRSEV